MNPKIFTCSLFCTDPLGEVAIATAPVTVNHQNLFCCCNENIMKITAMLLFHINVNRGTDDTVLYFNAVYSTMIYNCLL